MKLKPLVEKLKAALLSEELADDDDFFYDVALLDQAVRQGLASKKIDADQQEAEVLLLHLWRNDLYCRFQDAPKVPADTYLCQTRLTGHHPTGEETGVMRPVLISGGAFEMNRKRH